MKYLAAIFLIAIMQALTGCSSSNITVIVSNDTVSNIDSMVLYIQNYRLIINHIPVGASLQKQVPKDSIYFNHHDFMVRASVYDKITPEGRNGMYYDDLTFAGSSDKYIITATHNLEVTIIA